METKICSKCKEDKNICEFSKRKDRKSGYRSECKLCGKITLKNYYNNNRNDILIKKQKFYENNKESELNRRKKNYAENRDRELLRMKKYNQENKEYFKEYDKKHRKTYENNRLKIDPIFKLSKNLRRRITLFLKTKNLSKNNTTFDIIGCSPEYLKEHLENQFTEGMSWNLMGKHIHIDHIIPLSSSNNEEEIYKLCHYTNLQPLWSKDNLIKGSKLL
jgi:hypothetical protein